ncbi:redoxin domain-containing protein [Gracilimonas sp.]|uniref:redoxin domain-containing protein n=1 Tax=Gracilimonas sp. TaxID=1974203 RepID=UPI002871FED5|nr:TlpA disulfide reductase family protein [Gracilimonas sp.]
MNLFYTLIFGLLLFSSCSNSATTTIEGTIDYLGDTPLILEEKPVHYKYAPVQRDTITVDSNGDFTLSITVEEPEIRQIILEDQSYPLYVTPGNDLTVQITRSNFPKNVQVEGYEQNWDTQYNDYLNEIDGLDTQISEEEEKIKVGEDNQLLRLSKQKYETAKKYLQNTPLDDYYLKTIGEYLVFKVRAIEYNDRHFDNFDADSAREVLFAEADSLGFFTYESQLAQRAGIRDFTHYYSRTFGIYDSVKAAYGMDLSEYDIKQVAYEELNEKRIEVMNHIEDRDALAHARMHLIAERIGEQGIETAQPSYDRYLEEFSDYPKYTEFLRYFYNEIKSVSPGQPAVPFAIPDIDGNIHTMEDYRGKFVLLDFWAGWCQPCLEEFPHMKEIYQNYSRDELEIVGISNEVDSLVWVQDIQRLDLPWPQLYSGDGFQEETFRAYKGGGIPFYILVDPDGKIARYNDIRASFNFTTVFDSLLQEYQNQQN